MTIETLSDAVSITKVLYQGRSKYLFKNLEWWCEKLGPDKPLLTITPEDLDAGIQFLLETPALKYWRGKGILPTGGRRTNGTINRYIGSLATMYKVLRLHRRLPRTFVRQNAIATRLRIVPLGSPRQQNNVRCGVT